MKEQVEKEQTDKEQINRFAINSEIVKEFIIIIMGLTFANIIRECIISFKSSITSDNIGIDPYHSTLFLLGFALLISVVRFYHGNVKLVVLEQAHDEGKPSFHQAYDFFMIIVEGAILSALGFFIDRLNVFTVLVISLFIVDAIWFLSVMFSKELVKFEREKKTWFAISLFAGGILAAIVYGFKVSVVWALIVILLFSALGDYALNFTFYFPKKL